MGILTGVNVINTFHISNQYFEDERKETTERETFDIGRRWDLS
jgi:hypothetical protein